MELNGFRELLLKKAEDSPTLQVLIKYMKDDIIIEKVMESLEKMARTNASMGRMANGPVTSWGGNMTNNDVNMLRDAISHHVAHHKAALKSGNRSVADQHLNKIVPLMHLAAKAAPHSGGLYGMDYIPTEGWETNYTTHERRPETGKLKEGTKGLGRRPKTTNRETNERGVPDYKYLEMKPHPLHEDRKRYPHHSGGYPFEEIQIGDPAKIKEGATGHDHEAFLHVPDVRPQDKFVPHPFDQHPINRYADIPENKLTDKDRENFHNALQQWDDSEPYANWKEGRKNHPDLETMGRKKPEHHFEGAKLQDQPPNVKKLATTEGSTPAPPTPESTPAVATAPGKVPDVDMSKLPAALRAKFQGGK